MSSSNWSTLHARLHQTLRQRQLLKRDSRILVAVSGGQDSLCLIKLLIDLQPLWQWDLAIAHCDHRWSSDEGMADHVQKLASDWGIPFYLKTAVTAIAETEAAARTWRYQALTEIATEFEWENVVTGHTKSDRAETFLYNLIRGAGIDGLSSLWWQRPLTPTINLVRPLLNISRTETYQFCQEYKLPIWSDEVNKNLKYKRNRLRADVIPYLQTHFNPQVETALTQTAELLRAEVEYLEAYAHEILQQAMTPNHQGLNRDVLKTIPLALQRRVIRLFLDKFLPKTPTFAQIEAVTELINAPNGTRTSSFPGKVYGEVVDSVIVLVESAN